MDVTPVSTASWTVWATPLSANAPPVAVPVKGMCLPTQPL